MAVRTEPIIEDRRLQPIYEKVYHNQRLSFEDGVALYRSADILAVGYMANLVRERIHGNVTYFNVNRHINPTDVCVASCKLCAFGKKARDPKAYTMSLDQVYETAGRGYSEAVSEFHIVGGLHPELTLDWYCEMLRGLKQRFPQAHLKAFTAIEIGWFAKREKITIEETLRRMRDAGLGSLPGGGAEIFHPEVREIICDGKLDADEWIEVHRIAHRMGIKSNCTMLYGHVEKPFHKVDHLMRLRALQDETGGFNAFIPLAYHPENNYMGLKYHTTGTDDLRHIATSRLVLDNIPHIKAYWIMISPKLAQVALRFGADDLDGTVVEETIYHMAGAGTPQQMTRAELERIVRLAGFEPIERDTLYNPLAASVPPVHPPSAPAELSAAPALAGGA